MGIVSSRRRNIPHTYLWLQISALDPSSDSDIWEPPLYVSPHPSPSLQTPRFHVSSATQNIVMATQSFVYKPLVTHTDIRVLQVSHSADNNAEVSATFEIESLASAASPQFDALSYMWDDQTERAAIFIDGALFSISKHLCRTLRALRDPTRPRRLWVDAICIDQNDTRERNKQVQLMRTIYQRAYAVLVWLNRHVDALDDAFRTLLTINASSTTPDLGDSPAFWGPLVNVFKDAYWGRLDPTGDQQCFCPAIVLLGSRAASLGSVSLSQAV